MRRTNSSKTLGLGLDHGLEGVVAQSPLLLKIGTDGKHVVIGQGFVQERAIRRAARGCRETQGRFGRMRRQQRIVAKSYVCGGAGPGVSRRVVGHASADRIEVDVPVAAQDIAFAVDQAGLVSAFPQRSRTLVPSIELTDVLTPKLLHQSRGHAGIGWCHQEVNVIVHEHVGMKKATRVQQRVAEQMQITLPVGVIEKAGEAIVASLHDVLRNAGQIESRKSGHEASVATHPSYRGRHGRADRVSHRHAVTPEVNLTPFLNQGLDESADATAQFELER